MLEPGGAGGSAGERDALRFKTKFFLNIRGRPVIGLYDHQGVLRVSGALEDCLAYAELFDFDGEDFSLVPLLSDLPAHPHPGHSS